MRKLLRFYIQNRKRIWLILLTFFGAIMLVQALNNYYKNNKSETNSSVINNTTISNNTNYSVVTKKQNNDTITKEATNVINTFIEYCNNNQIEAAYNLLTEDCKQLLYKNIEEFRKDYYDRMFLTKKNYSIQAWANSNIGYTYRINLREDALSTGKYSASAIEEYYTIIKENEEYKLNISNYVGKEEINKTSTSNGITIEAYYKYVYIDYEIYILEVKNNTDNEIKLDSKEQTSTIYLLDSNNVKYIAYLHEILEDKLIILNGVNSKLTIKFNKNYNPNLEIEKIVFSDIIVDTRNYENRCTLQVDI